MHSLLRLVNCHSIDGKLDIASLPHFGDIALGREVLAVLDDVRVHVSWQFLSSSFVDAPHDGSVGCFDIGHPSIQFLDLALLRPR